MRKWFSGVRSRIDRLEAGLAISKRKVELTAWPDEDLETADRLLKLVDADQPLSETDRIAADALWERYGLAVGGR
jgi:hypothetical protein